MISFFYFLFSLYYFTLCYEITNQKKLDYISINNMSDIENVVNDNLTNKIKNIYEKEYYLFNEIQEISLNHINKLTKYKKYYDFINGLSYSFSLSDNPSKTINYLNSKNQIIVDDCSYFHSVQIKHLKENKHLLICINKNFSLISFYNISESNFNYLSSVKLNIAVDINNTQISFSGFEEDNSVIFLSNNEVFIIVLQINFSEGNAYIPIIQKFPIELLNQKDSKMIFYDIVNYHLNRYLVLGYNTGEILIYLCKTNSILLKTHITFPSKIDKLFLQQGLLLIVYNSNKLTVLTLLGGNSILVVCNNYYPILDLIYDHINSILYILDIKGRLIIKNFKVNLNKVYSNECETLYQIFIPKYSRNNINDIKLIFVKGDVFINGKNYLGFLNKKFELENYFVRSDLISKEKIFNDGKIFYFYSIYLNKFIIYKIDLNKFKNKVNKSTKEKDNNKKQNENVDLYNDFKPVECNGNILCSILFNTYTNNKNTTFYFYILAVLIVVLSVYFYNKRRQNDLLRYKEFEENRIKGNQETNNKLQEMLGQIKHLEKFENYEEYKKRERKNYNQEEEKNPYSNFNDNEIQYHGDDDDDDEDELNEELRYLNQNDSDQMKAYHDYVNQMNKKEENRMRHNNYYPRKYYSDDEY